MLLARVLDRGERVGERERDEGVGLVVAVVDVVGRAELLDEVRLEDEAVDLGRGDEVVEDVDLRHHQRHHRALVVPADVLAHARAQRLGLADVEDLARGVLPQVDAGRLGDLRELRSQVGSADIALLHRLQRTLDAGRRWRLGGSGNAPRLGRAGSALLGLRRPLGGLRRDLALGAMVAPRPSSTGFRNRPVCDVGCAAISSGVPATTISPPRSPPSGPEVDDPVGRLDDVEVVLDHEHGVAGVDQPLQHHEQLAHVVEVQPGGRLVEDVERPPGAAPLQLARQLHALRLAARQRRGRLPELDVAEPHVVERLQLALDRRDVLEEVQRLLDRHVQHVGDVAALVGDLQRLAVVAGALAHLARHVDVGQEVHLDLDLAVALARLAAAARPR